MRKLHTISSLRRRPQAGRAVRPKPGDLPTVNVTASPPAIPSATYRLQFSRNFRFEDAARILDSLRELGITHVYASPILGSRRGSEHGYDATDPTRIDPDLGSEEDFFAFQDELRKRGMGMVLDIVPNHMSASSENPWWMDVLENGPDSAYASYFDIDWHPGPRSLEGRILLPVLGQPFGEVLESSELHLRFRRGKFSIQYYESTFPLSPKSYRHVLIHRIDKLKEMLDESSGAYGEYVGILESLAALFRMESSVPESAADKRLKFEGIRGRLEQLLEASGEVKQFVQENIEEFNGTPGDPASYRLLEALLSEQYFKLAHWQNINESINYRRFFTITDLVGMRIEDPAVFEATHFMILRIAARQASVGLRIDHIDGLRDPERYLHKLRERLRETAPKDRSERSYLLVEKILSQEEQLPATWPVDGTTGYDYLNFANGIFVYRDNADALEKIYSRFVGKEWTSDEVVLEKKRLVMNGILGVEMRSLGRRLAELAGDDRYAQELPRPELISALLETTACLSVYRTYARNLALPDDAKLVLERAIEKARASKPHLNPACFDFLCDVLLLSASPHVLPRQREARLAFVMRWQQFTGPVTAKGVEDTALFVYYPLLSLNEVGGAAQLSAATSKEQFFHFLKQRQERWPHSMNATTTHDTKRSEDVRARINVLSEVPEQWEASLHRWAGLNAVQKLDVAGQKVPDPNEEYFLYQTLLGAYPAEREPSESLLQRLQDHIVKATREANVHTRWTRPNVIHEQALSKFVENILNPRDNQAFLADFLGLHETVSFFGMVNSLSQALLKIACPGVPDFYQGSEFWDLRLVDPDNRHPIDFELWTHSLSALRHDERRDPIEEISDLLARWPNGRVKLWLVSQALRFRYHHLELFTQGDFLPLETSGKRAECVVSFLRHRAGDCALVVVPRWLAQAQCEPSVIPPPEFWSDTRIHLPSSAPRTWRNVLTNERIVCAPSSEECSSDEVCIQLGEILRYFPVGLLSAATSEAKEARAKDRRTGLTAGD